MTKENVSIVEATLRDAINRYLYCSEVRDSEGDEEARVLFLEEANLVKRALNEFLKENENEEVHTC